jgi:hypothetical protein
MGTEGEMLQAPTATARARRGDKVVVGRARRTTSTIIQPGITALERHFENLKVLGIRLGALIGADSGNRGEAGYSSPSIRCRRKVCRYYGLHVLASSEVPIRWGPRWTDLSGNPAQRHLRLLVNVAKKCCGRGPPFNDLSQEGNASFVRAVDWFDPERVLRLSTYATWWICQGVQRGPRDRGRAMISLPVHGGNRLAKAHAAHATLSAELGRDTGAAEELAVRLG